MTKDNVIPLSTSARQAARKKKNLPGPNLVWLAKEMQSTAPDLIAEGLTEELATDVYDEIDFAKAQASNAEIKIKDIGIRLLSDYLQHDEHPAFVIETLLSSRRRAREKALKPNVGFKDVALG